MLKILITASLLSGYLCAQTAPSSMPLRPYQPAFTELKAALGLSDEQIDRLKQIQQSRYQLTTQLYDQIGQKQKALNDMLTSGSTDALAIGKMEIELQQLRKQTQVDKTSTYHEQALAVLTPEQKAKLTALEEALKMRMPAEQALSLLLITAPPPVMTPMVGRPIGPNSKK